MKFDLTDAQRVALVAAAEQVLRMDGDDFASAALRPALAVLNADAIDGRAVQWRTRIRLYRDGLVDPQADTDPNLEPDAPGVEIVSSLPGVAEWLGSLAAEFHTPHVPAELDRETLLHRLKALRPTISRRGGNAAWRVPYTVDGQEWTARVDVERVMS